MKARHWLLTLASLFAIPLLAGCVDEDVVFQEDPIFTPPADATNGFLGYFAQDDKTTSCGNCHVGKQGDWENSAHAHAWESLQNSGSAQDFCSGCHAVSENGNALTAAAGYNLVPDARYQDVQCESCHGPGFEHVQNPDAIQPLAPARVGVELTTGCGECHSGTHHPFVEQWATSRHGTVPAQAGTAGSIAWCKQCHEGKTALEVKFLETDEYLEKGDGQNMPITCAVCHDPHGSPNDAQLRAPIDVASTEHLCVRCHARTGTPPSSQGPHAAQGFLVLGQNVGYIPDGFQYDPATAASSHGTDFNPKLCATCHVKASTLVDVQGDFLVQSVGHTFEAIPCLDPNTGLPGTCATLDERDFSACATSGCHTDEPSAILAFQTIKDSLNTLLDLLWVDTDNNSTMDATDAGLLPQVVAQGDPTQINVTDNLVTAAEGALWNAQLAYTDDRLHFGAGVVFGNTFSAHRSSGNGVHNPFLLKALLLASINDVTVKYNLTPPPGFGVTPSVGGNR